jgi:hypothetical protein
VTERQRARSGELLPVDRVFSTEEENTLGDLGGAGGPCQRLFAQRSVVEDMKNAGRGFHEKFHGEGLVVPRFAQPVSPYLPQLRRSQFPFFYSSAVDSRERK